MLPWADSMNPLLWFIDFRVRTQPAPRLTATCAMPENPASRAVAEFYCLFPENARKSSTHIK
jgi:hypothetical protein